MRMRLVGLLVVAIVALTLSPATLAQTAAQPGAAKAKPDLSGVWLGERDGPGGFGTTEEPSMQPWAREIYKTIRKGVESATDRSPNEGDPILYPYCMPVAFPRVYSYGIPFEIVQVPGRVLMLFEADNQVRRIYTDGRKHIEGAPPVFFGHSIGKWEGDTLVVETVGLESLDGLARIDALGHPHSDALRVEERIRRVDHDALEINFLFDDPKAYTRPWKGKKVFKLQPDWNSMEYPLCQDEQKAHYVHDVLGDKSKH